ncbi:2Fe-2S iron-sulfur cluster-binding protein [Shewanella corallii]|uniref:2Fe-2S iron-sulfur cluster-binding protein n=1 Tax=Shewanella corallii TaxID=560080 RepID=A0ABT0N4A5_9GAMM|nr:2Fe-2S iron-sulfur cluster-binding protein [Shewanella corallii]MCL2913274.1 2Fe-2S iron-sulfur cluster-binding protein [Shewanella corallii]
MNNRLHTISVAAVTPLTKDSVAVSFDVPLSLKHNFQFQPGQYLTLESEIENEKVRRCYSISAPVSADRLEVGIKRVPDGKFSGFAIDQLAVGDTLQALPPAGNFICDTSVSKRVCLIAAGSGITPMLSIAESLLQQQPESQVSLVYGNQTRQSMMFRERLFFLKNRYLGRFELIPVFSREESDIEVHNGRVSTDKLVAMNQGGLLNLESIDEFYLCGPSQMVSEVETGLINLGFDKFRVHTELFFAGDQIKQNAERRQQEYGDRSRQVKLKIAGRKLSIQLAASGETILDAALAQGADLPFSCKGGVCATCKARVIKGQVEMDLNHSLTEQEVESGMVLTCQSHPISDDVEIDFDVT